MKPLLAAGLVALTIVLAGCGGGDPSTTGSTAAGSSPASSATSTSAPAPSSPSETVTVTASPQTGSPSTAPGGAPTTPTPPAPATATPTSSSGGPFTLARALAAVRDGAQEHGYVREASFVSHDGSVYCQIASSEGGGVCELADGAGIEAPGVCAAGDGRSQVGRIEVDERGRVVPVCNSDTIVSVDPATLPRLQEGRVAQVKGAWSCLDTARGITCVDPQGRRAFRLGRSGYAVARR
ncbi:hypothetical protein [Arsenicicoccus bolidensis]|uniref:Uncharacterized protein n=1 Tax=Arsenicicoccus bolidensis TaxID=229480 RepID=A0ABS9Q0C9_9MICO|nr:hypothetical protein [Arsenicicoccus bolidensis]MCG7321338.1 hypothetical protein [Arsenicicoccus bolidensis]